MKRMIAAYAAVCITALSLIACSPGAEVRPNAESAPAETAAASPYADMVLSREQMLSDYDSMWTAMGQSYPFWGVLSREHPENPHYYDEVIADYRKQIQVMQQEGDDAMWRFIEIISGSLYDVCGSTGHAGILNPRYFRDFHSANERYVDEMPDLQPWVDIGRKEEVNAFYEYYDHLIARLLEAQAQTETGDTAEEAAAELQAEPNLYMEKLSEEKQVAYIRVDSFEDSMMESDLPEIRSFLNEVRDYNHLIIDTRNNSGGNTVYWENAFVRPNISAPMTYRVLRLMEDNDLTRQFYVSMYKDSSISIEDIKNDPGLDRLPEEDMGGMAFAREITDTLEPELADKLFQGKIWVLTGPDMFSSSEAFAVFCKETGFATLVGQTTGGSDSGGAVWYELPESHLLVLFDVEYCLNPDGSCNMEIGTVPDIESDDALGTVLEVIGL